MSLNTDNIDWSPLPWDTWLCTVCGYRLVADDRRRLERQGKTCPDCGFTAVTDFQHIEGTGMDDV